MTDKLLISFGIDRYIIEDEGIFLINVGREVLYDGCAASDKYKLVRSETLRNERARTCHDLAFEEVIRYNKANLERVKQNEGRQQNKMQSRGKRRKA